MTILYALAAPAVGTYAAMALVSAVSARRANPGVRICLFTDLETKQALQACRHGLLAAVDEVVVADVPTRDPLVASRFLKTSAAATIGGPLLLLDCDVLVRGDLSGLFSLPAEIAAAPNHSADTWSAQIFADDLAMMDAMGWTPRRDVYLNAGVIFWSGSDRARRLSARWHELWTQSHRQLGMHKDQASFNALVRELGDELGVLPHRFNAQFRVRPRAAEGAAVWHYYLSGGEAAPTTAFERVIAKVVKRRTVTVEEVAALMDQPDPWSGGHILDRLVVRRVLDRERIGVAERAWFEGRRNAAVAHWGRAICSSVCRRVFYRTNL